MGLYIVGIPLYILILLLRNRKALHDKSQTIITLLIFLKQIRLEVYLLLRNPICTIRRTVVFGC